MAAGGSTKVVVLALLANAGIASAKLIGALVTHSGSMMAEAVHSFADAGHYILEDAFDEILPKLEAFLGSGRAAE